MKRLIFATLVLLIVTVSVTIIYFKNLNTTTLNTSQVLSTIPNNASLIFEFNNEKGFYDIFSDNKLFDNFIGEEKMIELAALKKLILQNTLIDPYLNGQNLFISLHPQKGTYIDLLITASVSKGFNSNMLESISKQPKSDLVINTIEIAGKPGYTVYLKKLKKRFYLINKDDRIISGSFSKELIEACVNYDNTKEKQPFVLLSDLQSRNSLANLYVNYEALSPLFEQLFINKNPDIFRSIRELPAFAALTLNYKNDAIMFNGTTQINIDSQKSYLSLFINQKPIINHLKGLFPSTTAYSTNFAISDPIKFESDLTSWLAKNFKNNKQQIINKVKTETGINLRKEFTRLLSNEFAIVTTRYQEKIAIIQVKDGAKLHTLLANLSTLNNDDTGQFNYEKLPQLLLGEPFGIFKKPYFKVIGNYLILANTLSELASYNDSYINRKFITKTDRYNQFATLLAEQSNISFFIQFKNAQQLFKQNLKPAFYNALTNTAPGWKNFYGAAWQFTSSDNNFYTNFCIYLTNDTIAKRNISEK